MGTLSTTPPQVPSIQQFIKTLANRHGVDLCQLGLSLTLIRPGQPDSLLLYNAGLDHLVMAHLIRDPDGQLFPEVEFLFFTGDSNHWKPVEIRYSPVVWLAYRDATGQQDNDGASANNGEAMLNGFVAYWAEHLVEEGWLAAGRACVRIIGCQSTSHPTCYGMLWQCAVCHRTFCCAEGTDDHPELCDDCWAARFAPEVIAETPPISFTESGTLQLPSDWLEEAIRHAVPVQQATTPTAHHEGLND